MASTKEFHDFIMEQLSRVESVTTRKMMGEYLIYVSGRLIGGIYDDCLLLKDTPAARGMLPNASRIAPYPGARKMLMVDNLDDKLYLNELIEAVTVEHNSDDTAFDRAVNHGNKADRP